MTTVNDMKNEKKSVAELLEGVEADAWLRVSNISGLSTRASLSDGVELASESIFPLRCDATLERVIGPVLAALRLSQQVDANNFNAHHEVMLERISQLEKQNANLSRAVVELTETKDTAYLSGIAEGRAEMERACPNAAHMGKHACKNRHQCWEPCGELGHSEKHARPMDGYLQELADESRRLGLYDVPKVNPLCVAENCSLHPEIHQQPSPHPPSRHCNCKDCTEYFTGKPIETLWAPEQPSVNEELLTLLLRHHEHMQLYLRHYYKNQNVFDAVIKAIDHAKAAKKGSGE
ncbi:MAG: hypothetical protein JWN23_1130 [Rhodocyclales bacterium]|nr:hypothetical protein [Rhodocyclales bacterium]